MGSGAAEIVAAADGGSKSNTGTAPTPTPVEPTNHTTTGRAYLSRDGASATLPDGTVVNAGAGGQLALDDNGNLVATRPSNGYRLEEGVVDVIHYSKTGQVIGIGQEQVIVDPLHPDAPEYNTKVVQGQEREITVTNTDGSTSKIPTTFQVGVGWVESGTGEVVQDIATWRAQPNAQTTTDTALQQLIDAFDNPTAYAKDHDILLADAGNTTGTVSDAGQGGNVSEPNQPPPPPTPSDYTHYLAGPGSHLSDAQQNTLAAQLDTLGLGGADGAGSLNFYTLPGGTVLIGNAQGELVGEISTAANGELHLQVSGETQGRTAQVDVHIADSGQATSYSPYQLGQVNATLSLLQGLDGLHNWDRMDDKAHFSTLLGLGNNINTLSNGALGKLGTLNTIGSLLSLGQSLEDGNTLGTLSSLNSLSDSAIDGALNTALGSTGVPYLSIAMSLSNLEEHPGQAIGSLIGMMWGPMGSAIGGMIGGALDSAFAAKPPPPEGITHYEWDATGAIQIRVDHDQSHGADYAQSTAASVQELLGNIVQSINDKNPDPADNVALNPYLLPRVGFSDGHAWLETTLPEGGTFRESIRSDNLAQRLLDVLIDNGGIAPVWQVQTQQGHLHQLLQQGASQADIAAELGAGKGGGAQVGNQAYALQGNAVESADFKSQSFEALVLKVQGSEAVQTSAQALQDQAVRLSEIYKDVENDGYFESTQWIAATDTSGNTQGDYCYTFDSCLRTWNMPQRPVLFTSANDAEWRNAA